MSIKKTLLFLVSLTIFSVLLTAQHRELAVQPYGQKASLWCWAASMDMIMDYHQPAVMMEQCDLAQQHLELLGTGPPSDPMCDCDCAPYCPGPCDLADLPYPPCNQFILFTRENVTSYGTTFYFYKSFFDILFTNNDYYSMEDYKKLNWEQYKFEIDQCRPVVFMYNITGLDSTTPISFNHSTVGKGYTTLTGMDASMTGDYFIVNDPWEVCNGETYLLNKSALTGTVPTPIDSPNKVLQVNKFQSMVHHIAPKENTCDPCESIPEENRLINAEENRLLAQIKRYRKDFAPIALGDQFSPNALKEFTSKGHYFTPVEYFSYEFFDTLKGSTDLSFNNAILDTDIREVTHTLSDPRLTARIRCSEADDLCAVEKIGLERKSPNFRVYVPEADTVFLLNNPDDKPTENYPPVPYTIVRYPPTTFEFYRFQYQEATYYYPVEAYTKRFFYGQEFIDSEVAIPEKLVLLGLEKYTKDFDVPKLVDKSPGYREKYRNILNGGGFLKMGKYLKRNKF